ncbi:non-ribosomal peptide synthetase [Streptomyces sp. NEAU-S77]|uniref:non-ribosomal peptide synthetase n=1 Tax=Streptomyces sp. NEAU-S77 TaxID=3411033 RepID=UPI003BA268E9
MTDSAVRTGLVPGGRTGHGRPAGQPASVEQKALLLVEEVHPDTAAYTVPVVLRIRGPLETAALRRALAALVARHEALRTTLHWHDGALHQRVHDGRDPVFRPDLPAEDPPPGGWRAAVANEALRPVDVRGGPVMRARLLRLTDGDHVLSLVFHHAVVDGWSLRILLDELSAAYAAHAAGMEPPALSPAVPYRAHSARQATAAWQREVEEALAHWRGRLDGPPAGSGPRTDRERPAVQDLAGAVRVRRLDGGLAAAVRSVSLEHGVTPFVTLLAAYCALVSRSGGESDLLVGSPWAGRPRAEDEDVVGCFVNTLVYRVDLSGDPAFGELTERVRESVWDTVEHQVPFDRLVGEVVRERDPGLPPLVHTTFGTEPPHPGLVLDGCSVEPVPVHNGCAKFDLSWVVADDGDALTVRAEYATRLYDAATVDALIDRYEVLLTAALDRPGLRLSRLPLLRPAEHERLLRSGQGPALPRGGPGRAEEAFARQAAAAPSAVAVEQGGTRLTYRELDQRSDRLAAVLRGHGVAAERLVGLMADRTPDFVTAVLAVWKAGGAYLPLDPEHPADRIRYVLDDARPALLITDREQPPGHVPDTLPVLRLDRWSATGHAPSSGTPVPEPCASPRSLAYVIYTSGSTGAPKGTSLEHRGVVNLAAAQRGLLGELGGARVLQFSRVTFDASVWEMVMALLSGGTLCLPEDTGPLSGSALAAEVRGSRATHLTVPPSVLSSVPAGDDLGVEVLVAAGEELPASLADRWSGRCRMVNAYGPTETTVAATAGVCAPGGGRPGIGGAIGGTEVYVLDAAMNAVPVGAPGELHIGGAPLARGYLGRPGLTAERFVPHPFTAQPGERLYRTGDLVRWRTDGQLEFLGRADRQVKVRGVRVEPGELEEALRSHPDVANAAVTARGGTPQERRLVAYVEAASATPPTSSGLAGHLRTLLPGYLVPSAFVVMDRLPLTSHGKTDYAALPDPGRDRQRPEHGRLAPRGGTETALAAMWAEILGLERVGADDDFFALGGTSVDLVRLRERIETRWRTRVPMTELFRAHNVRLLAAHLDHETAPHHDTGPDQDTVPDRTTDPDRKTAAGGRAPRPAADPAPDAARDQRHAAVSALRARKGRTRDAR